MRTQVKAHAKQVGHSKAVNYRNGLFSVCSDLEAMVDAYGAAAIIHFAMRIERDLAEFGDSIYNAQYNAILNAMPLPVIRKQNKAKAIKSKKPR